MPQTHSNSATGDAAPLEIGERVVALDVLRGVALFGVFLLNMIALAEPEVLATSIQLDSLPTAHLDRIVLQLINWLLLDKANTLFAFLFGLGFALQMQRLDAYGVDAVRIYRRRLTVLLLFGIVHVLFIWMWEILHLYALAGFALLALRNLRTRTLLIVGSVLTLFGRIAQEVFAEFGGLNTWHGLPTPYSDAAASVRQALSSAGDYVGLLRETSRLNLIDYLLNASIIGWFLYVLGRFMLGAWVGRRQWLQRAADLLPGYRCVLRWTLPAGLLVEGISRTIFIEAQQRAPSWEHWFFVGRVLHLLAVPVLATGYLCAIVVAVHSIRGRRLLAPFAYSGRMALTNYVAQSFFLGLVLTGIGPGADLAGRMGVATILLLVIVAYLMQILLSRWWLARFCYGPLEWVWRGLTYGRWPPFTMHRSR